MIDEKPNKEERFYNNLSRSRSQERIHFTIASERPNCKVPMVGGGLRLGLWMRYWVGLRLAPFVPTPLHVARRMLDLACVQSTDFVVDLGCGDGRLLLSAAKVHGAKGYGVELDPQLFADAQKAVRQENLGHLITLEMRDALEVDLTAATVVTLYLSEKGNSKLLPKLQNELPSRSRVVSFCWPFAGVDPSRIMKVDGINLYLYEKSSLNMR